MWMTEWVGGLIANSGIRRLYVWLVDSLNTGVQNSVSRAIAHRIGIIWRASFAYSWLTAEPEPDVIVIDLRETVTIGPLLRLVAWLSSPFVRALEHSVSRSLALAAGRAATGSTLLVIVARLLEPPPLPEEQQDEEPNEGGALPDDPDSR
jgi:hypothetical protein